MAIPTSVASAAAVEVSGVGRVFHAKGGPVTALRDIDLRIEPGELFGLLGPNGAGKSTLIKILSTLLLPSSGRASIFGLDVVDDTARVRRIMNLVAGGDFSGYGLLTVREQLAMFAQFYGMPYREGMRRVDAQIEAFGITEIRDRKISALSTGQRQKLNFARSFLNEPWMLFLDEPTIGLDVSAARDVRDRVRAFQAEQPGRTVLLTTHYMAEADEMCDRIAIVDRGRVLAQGTPSELKRMVQRETLFIVGVDALPASMGLAALRGLPGVVSVVPSSCFTPTSRSSSARPPSSYLRVTRPHTVIGSRARSIPRLALMTWLPRRGNSRKSAPSRSVKTAKRRRRPASTS